MNRIYWSRKAAKQLFSLHPLHQVRDAVNRLERMPDVREVKRLRSHQCGYRLRVGRYRVLFDWDGTVRVVSIQEVRKRDERTYG